MTKIYTKTGDGGETGLHYGVRVRKNAQIIHVMGEIDELSSFIGLARNSFDSKDEFFINEILKGIQGKLYVIGAELSGEKFVGITENDVGDLENLIDKFTADKKFGAFVNPGEKGEFSARLHVCRSVCRRAERALVSHLDGFQKEDRERFKYISQYLNRLSDLLFSLAELK